MLNFYQHIPEHISPIAFSIGSFSVRWYSLAYLAGFLVVYWLLVYRIKKECHSGLDPESMELIACKSFESVDSCFRRNDKKKEIQNLILDFLLYSFIGLLIGTRLGYALFYNFSYFSHNPLAIISPFSFDGNFVGIFGMSYFGGLFGVVIAAVIFCKVKGVNFWKWSDFVIPAIPAGYFFGRIGNFLNGELYGKATNHFWGMYFGDGILRHPTQLYEALLEGVLLFLILWPPTTFSDNSKSLGSKFRKVVRDKPGTLFTLYIVGYGVIRFFIEFLREPEGGLVLGMTVGQWLSLLMVTIAVILYVYPTKKYKVIE